MKKVLLFTPIMIFSILNASSLDKADGVLLVGADMLKHWERPVLIDIESGEYSGCQISGDIYIDQTRGFIKNARVLCTFSDKQIDVEARVNIWDKNEIKGIPTIHKNLPESIIQANQDMYQKTQNLEDYKNLVSSRDGIYEISRGTHIQLSWQRINK